jgi:hypothetical protein
MARTSAPQDPPAPRSQPLWAYCLAFVLLTSVLTVVFVFVLRRPPAPVKLERVRPAAQEAAAPATPAPAETRQVHVTSRPSGALVTYQGQALGATPLDVALPAEVAGALEVAKEGFVARTVTVEPGQDDVHVRLRRDRNVRRPAAPAGEPAAPGDAPAGEPAAPAGPAREGAPAGPAPARAGEPGTEPGAGQGDPVTPAPARKPATPAPTRSSARRAPAPADPALSRDGASANPGS